MAHINEVCLCPCGGRERRVHYHLLSPSSTGARALTDTLAPPSPPPVSAVSVQSKCQSPVWKHLHQTSVDWMSAHGVLMSQCSPPHTSHQCPHPSSCLPTLTGTQVNHEDQNKPVNNCTIVAYAYSIAIYRIIGTCVAICIAGFFLLLLEHPDQSAGGRSGFTQTPVKVHWSEKNLTSDWDSQLVLVLMK